MSGLWRAWRPSRHEAMSGGHRLALGFSGAVALVWGAVFALTLARAELPREESGRVVAVYPFGWDSRKAAAAAFRTEARLVRDTWLPNAIEVISEQPGFAGRLQDSGAVAVYRAEPFSLFTLAGCTGLPPGLVTRSLRRFG